MNWLVFGFLSFLGLLTLTCLSERICFVKAKQTWENAKQYCEHNYTDLVTINDTETATQLLNKTPKDKKFWIGLHSTWQWSMTYVSNGIGYMNWKEGHPNRKNCVCIGMDGYWVDVECSSKHPFVCYDESQQNKYILIPERKTWAEAQEICRRNYTDLVTSRNSTENTQIANLLPTRQSKAFIGLFRDWMWSDETELQFSLWKQPEPNPDNNKCVLADFDKEGEWNSKACSTQHRFVCYDDQLLLVEQPSTWEEALEDCRKRSSDLVTVSSSRLQHWVSQKARNTTTQHVWLGLKYTCVLEFWFWVHGERMEYENWAEGSEGDCGKAGALDRETNKWVSLPVTQRLPFICEKCGCGGQRADKCKNLN